MKLVADVKIETNDDQSMNSEEVSKGMEELSGAFGRTASDSS